MKDDHRDGCQCHGCICSRYELEIHSLTNDLEHEREKVAAWEQKAANWLASPEAAQRLDGYRDLAQRLNVVEMQRDGLLAELRHCAEVFRQYEQLHILKCTDEGLEKAHRNGYLAARAEAAIASVKENGK